MIRRARSTPINIPRFPMVQKDAPSILTEIRMSTPITHERMVDERDRPDHRAKDAAGVIKSRPAALVISGWLARVEHLSAQVL